MQLLAKCKAMQTARLTSAACSVSAARRVRKKYLAARQHRREYRKLKQVLPAVCNSPKVSRVTLIEEAIRYIDYLHAEISHRFFISKSSPSSSSSSSLHARVSLVVQCCPYSFS